MKRSKGTASKNNFKNRLTQNFTIVPNTAVNDKRLSWKALGIFAYLASKPDDWNFYMGEIKKNATDGITSLRTGIKELEDHGYLHREPRWSEKEKKYNGWTWILTTPDLDKTNRTENLKDRKPIQLETYSIGNPDEYTKKDNTNTDNTNKEYNTPDPSESGESEKKKSSPSQRTTKYIPYAKHLAKTVRSHINYKIDSKRIKSWAKDLRLLHEQNGVHPKRMKQVLKWYRKNIGRPYIPEAFSGSAFRDKFPKLEAAIQRESGLARNGHSKPSNAHYEPDLKHKQAEESV